MTKGNQNAVKHNLYGFRDRGENALTEPQKSRYIELKQQFDSQPGRVEYRKDLAVHLATMVELGMSDIRKHAESGRSIWTSAPTARLGTYVNALIRLMDNWPKDQSKASNVMDLLRGDENDGT